LHQALEMYSGCLPGPAVGVEVHGDEQVMEARPQWAGQVLTLYTEHELPDVHVRRQDRGDCVVAMGTHRLVELQGGGMEAGVVEELK